jgi:hypothetical protein
MVKSHLTGSAAGIVERFVPRDGGVGAQHSKAKLKPSADIINSGPLGTTAADSATDRQQTGFWSLLVSSLMEGLAFYGASVHSMGFFPPEPFPEEPPHPAPRDIAVHRWRGPIRIISSKGPRDAASTRFDRDVNRASPAKVKPGSENGSKQEREIQKAAAALGRLDDLTLLSLGIPHRSYIEQTVRFCHDC